MSTANATQQDMMTPAQRVRSDWRSLVEKLSYKAIVTNIPFIGFLALLCVFYISNSHRAIEMQRDANKLSKELKELGWKYTDTKEQLLVTKEEGDVILHARSIGLVPPDMPAYKISSK